MVNGNCIRISVITFIFRIFLSPKESPSIICLLYQLFCAPFSCLSGLFFSSSTVGCISITRFGVDTSTRQECTTNWNEDDRKYKEEEERHTEMERKRQRAGNTLIVWPAKKIPRRSRKSRSPQTWKRTTTCQCRDVSFTCLKCSRGTDLVYRWLHLRCRTCFWHPQIVLNLSSVPDEMLRNALDFISVYYGRYKGIGTIRNTHHSPVKLNRNMPNLRNNFRQAKFWHVPLFRRFKQYVKSPHLQRVEGKKEAVFRDYLVILQFYDKTGL